MALRRRQLVKAAILAGGLGGAGRAQAQSALGPFHRIAGLAAEGYDVVAYFTEGRAIRGDVTFAHKWDDIGWLFSSAANRNLFAANPERYAPQYGGNCARSVADGKKAKGSGEAWTVINGKLYLNYSIEVRSRWLRDTSTFITQADEWWPQIRLRS